MKTIGIKLADGSFYPVLEEFSNSEKELFLTTAHNNQTKVTVDLYRSKNCSMDDAEYVDSLQIENLIAHPNGEPDISFFVSIDENNKLSAKIKDTETGKQSKTTITLVSRTLEERLTDDDYEISDSADAKDDKTKTQTPNRGFFAMASKIRKTNGEDENPPRENYTVIAFTPAADDEIFKQNDNQPDEEIIPDDETNDDILMEEIENNVIENENPMEISKTAVTEPLPDKDDEQTTDLNFDFSNDDAEKTEKAEIDAENETEIAKENSGADVLGENILDDDFFTENADFPNDFSNENIPNDENVLQENGGFPFAEKENFSTDGDFSDNSANENILDEEIFPDDATLDEKNNDFDLNGGVSVPDASGETFIAEEPFSIDEGDDAFSNENLSSENSDENTLNENILDDDFSLPNIAEDDSQNPAAESESDDFFNLDGDLENDNPQNENPENKGGALSFTGLYDKETELGESAEAEEEKIKRKIKIPVIICIVCAIICVIATLLILFIVPSKYNLLNKKTEKNATETAEIAQTEFPADFSEIEIEETEPLPNEEEPKPEIAPPAKEEEIVVIEEAEIVAPEQPPAALEKSADITYKIKWGDTLWDIADAYYKDPWRYKYIARYNRIKDPDYIISGTFIKIPAE